MKYIKEYKIFESDSVLRGIMDYDTYNNIREDISDILLDLTDEHYGFRTLLNNVESPSANNTGTSFTVEIYNKTAEGLQGWYMGRFKWEDVSEYLLRIYDYMVSNNWIGTSDPEVEGICVYYTGKYDSLGEKYQFFSADWGRFKHGMENHYINSELRSIKIKFTLGR